MAEDFYAANSEWYAALVASWQSDSSSAVSSLLGAIDGGDVVDIASGVGTCLPLLRRLGAERLFAVEPSASMRAGLMTTIACDPDLMRRTTVIAAPVPEAVKELPARWSAVVMLNALGHLDDETRVSLWATVRERLRPGGRFILSLQPPESVMTIPWTDFGTVQIGERRLTTRGQAEPLDDAHVLWTMEWSLTDAADKLLEKRTAHHPWRVLSRTQLSEEAAGWGLATVDDAGSDSFFALERS